MYIYMYVYIYIHMYICVYICICVYTQCLDPSSMFNNGFLVFNFCGPLLHILLIGDHSGPNAWLLHLVEEGPLTVDSISWNMDVG